MISQEPTDDLEESIEDAAKEVTNDEIVQIDSTQGPFNEIPATQEVDDETKIKPATPPQKLNRQKKKTPSTPRRSQRSRNIVNYKY